VVHCPAAVAAAAAGCVAGAGNVACPSGFTNNTNATTACNINLSSEDEIPRTHDGPADCTRASEGPIRTLSDIPRRRLEHWQNRAR
jgi:hypothetical protein